MTRPATQTLPASTPLIVVAVIGPLILFPAAQIMPLGFALVLTLLSCSSTFLSAKALVHPDPITGRDLHHAGLGVLVLLACFLGFTTAVLGG